MLNDPNLSGMLVDPNSSAPMEDQSFSQRITSFARLQQAMMQDYQEQPPVKPPTPPPTYLCVACSRQ